MWNLVRCYLSGRHDYGVGCEPGSIFLRCVHCGHRSSGWTVEPKATSAEAYRPNVPRAVVPAARPVLAVVPPPAVRARVIPFQRSAAQ
jgi:hypothetical protein